jgi:hypothetical protein
LRSSRWSTPKRVLLVHHGEAEPREAHAILDEGVGADRDRVLPRSQPGQGSRRLRSLPPGGEQVHAPGGPGQEPAEGEEVLLGEDLGWSHEGRLAAVLRGHDHGQERHQGLARAHVALDQAVHGVRSLQVVGDLLEHALLGAGEREWQHLLHRLAGPLADRERLALALLRRPLRRWARPSWKRKNSSRMSRR